MKKIAFLAMLVFLVTVGTSFAAFEAGTGGSLTVGTTLTATLKLSNNVKAEYTAETDGLGYVIATSHSSGTRTYGSSSGDSKIFYTDALDSSPGLSAPTGTASAGFTWTAL